MELSPVEKKPSEQKVYSLFKVPFLHKSDAPSEDLEEPRAADSPSVGSSIASGRTDPYYREENKEGKGQKLLNMLKKTLKGSENKDLDTEHDIPSLIPFGDVVGCLAVHIKRCRHFSPRINLQYYTNLFVRITVNKIMKCTNAQSVNFKNNEKKPAVKFDEVKYFSVQVPRRQDDERNMIYLELMEFDDLEAYPVLLGSFSLHLYEVIQKGCFTEEFQMKIRHLVICKVEVEFMFSYGNFGYGFSHQLKPLQKLIQPSMFMQIPPPVERTDPLTNVITPQLIEYPAFLSPDLNVTVGAPQKQPDLSSPVRLEKLQQQPRDRLDRMKKEYRNLKTWEEKSNYLDSVLHMKVEPEEFPDSKDIEGNNDLMMNSEPSFIASFSLPSGPETHLVLYNYYISILFLAELSLTKEEDKPPLSEGVSLPLVEKKAESPDSSVIIPDNAETQKENLPPEESTLLPPIPFKEKDSGIEPIDGRDDETKYETIESEKEPRDSSSPELMLPQNQPIPEVMDSIPPETKLKSSILSPERRKKSIDESGSETKKPIFRQESKRSSELLQDLKEDSEVVPKISLPRHVSFSFSHEALESPTLAEGLSLDEDKDKDKESVDSQNETDEEMEIVIRNTYKEENPFRQAHPESMPLFPGSQKLMKFEPLLKSVTEIPFKEDNKRKQSMPFYTIVKKDTPSAEIIEHEEQDPPYPPTSSNLTVKSENSSGNFNHDIFTIKSLDTEGMRGLSNISVENIEGETTNAIDLEKVQENLNPNLEKLEKSVDQKSLLNDDLKDLSEGFHEETEKSEQLSEVSRKKSSGSKSSIMDFEAQQGELSQSRSPGSEPSKTDLKIVQSEISQRPTSKSSKEDFEATHGDRSGPPSSKPSKCAVQDTKVELPGDLLVDSSSKSSKHDLEIAQSELSQGPNLSGKPSKHETEKSEPLSELPGTPSLGSKHDLETVRNEPYRDFSERSGSLSVLSGNPSLNAEPSKQDFEFMGIEVESSSTSKGSKHILKIVHSEESPQVGKSSTGSKFSKHDLKSSKSDPLSELLVKSSSSWKSSRCDLRLAKSEVFGERFGKSSSSSKSYPHIPKIAKSEALGELLGKTSSVLRSSGHDLKIAKSEQQLSELSMKKSSGSKSSKRDLKIVKSKYLSDLSVKKSSSSESSRHGFRIVKSEQWGELGRPSSGSKSFKQSLKIVSGPCNELPDNASSSSKSSLEGDLEIVLSDQSVPSFKSPSSKISTNGLMIVQSEQNELSKNKGLSSKLSSKEVLKNKPTETPSENLIELPEKVEECHLSQTLYEPVEEISIVEGDLSSGRKHSFKKKHPEESFQDSEEAENNVSVLNLAESFEYPEEVALPEQISSKPQITELDLEQSVSFLDLPESSIAVWDGGLASTSQELNEPKGVDLSKSKSFVRHIFLQTFPSDSLDSGIVSVIELNKDYQGSWMDPGTRSSEEKSTMMEEDWKLLLKNSKNQLPQDKDLPPIKQLYTEKSFEGKDLNSVLENASSYLMHKLSDSEQTRLTSFVSKVFNNLSTEGITELKENQTVLIPDGENEIEGLDVKSVKSMDKLDELNVKPVASPKHGSFEKFLGGPEAEHLKDDLSKLIQNFLLERLSEAGQFSKEDLPEIFEKLHFVSDKKESSTSIKPEIPSKEQKDFKDFPEISKTSMPNVNSELPLFDDRYLEIRLRDLLSEILQQYILSNQTETKLIRERESGIKEQNLPSYRTKTVPPFSHEVRHDYPERSFPGDSDLNRKGLLSQSAQNLLSFISESELLNLKSDLSKRLQSIFIERLSNMGLITEKEFYTLNENLSLINSNEKPLKFFNTDVRGINQFLERPSEKQSYKTFPRNMSQEVIDERISNIELARKLEREYFTLHNTKRRSSLAREDEKQYPRERAGKQGLTGVKPSRKTSQEFLFNSSSERITRLVLRREQKDHNLMQLPQVEKTSFEEEIQHLHSWYHRTKTNHSKATLKIKPLGKKEHFNIYKVTVKEKPESIPSGQNSEVQTEIKQYLYKYKIPSTSNIHAYLNSDDEEESNLKDQYNGKSKENNKKKPLLTVTQFQKEVQAVYLKPKETTTEKYTTNSQSFDHSRNPSIFPEVLKTEGLKPKLRREREYVEKQKRPLYRTAKILATSQPATRLLLRKSPQRTLLFPWAGKRNIHDSSVNKKEDLHLTSFKHLEKAKARARFDLGKSPNDNQYTFKNLARPNTAPEFNKRMKENLGKFTSPQVVSAGLYHINITNPGLEGYNQKKDLKNLEKCSIICDILQLLNSSYVKRKCEGDY
ncbi:cation channel sperm-associated targeting subunit tau [Macrotis lagotis]|uniref:cation channel sperm-associated targeting subunit tau n=1 Tax=Macrotis lagotis TaxID=92651 RepID=UPI003D681A8F